MNERTRTLVESLRAQSFESSGNAVVDALLQQIVALCHEAADALSAPSQEGEQWHLGSMNDGLFIINTPPRSKDYEWHDRPDGPTLTLNITELPDHKAKAVVDAHNAALRSAPPEQAVTEGELQKLRDTLEYERARNLEKVTIARQAFFALNQALTESIGSILSDYAATKILLRAEALRSAPPSSQQQQQMGNSTSLLADASRPVPVAVATKRSVNDKENDGKN